MQVSKKYRRCKCLRDDTAWLIVLPCPGYILLLMTDCWDIFLLLLQLCGDLELNPGPDELQQIFKGTTK